MSLNRADVIRHYNQLCKVLGLEPRWVVLSADAALVMLELRKHTDGLDVDIPVDDYNKVLQRKPEQQGLTGAFAAFDGITDLHCVPKDLTYFMELMRIDGVYVYSPARLIAQKEKMIAHPDRKPEKIPQDRKDIIALKELLDKFNNLHLHDKT